jgi:ketosteroid isomerase-like protein
MLAADFVSFADRMDRCWMEVRLPELAEYLAEEVVFVAPGGTPRSEGLAPAVDSYRQFLSHARVNRFQTSDHTVTLRGDTAVLEYRWQMDWTAAGADHAESGREVLVLARREEGWRVVWRTQIPQ